ncbi:hypothetical protein BC936DRAFT_140111 [Jimgerdemannia flammicorona]|uniref:S-adenosyl-L-methionine:L-histidine 3-amino-3-carboxypropyltransferase 2 n=1 Tax=Jimgerdemannia flammicorona TaxID=994334 RepID=A0A433B1Y1_9FUNG|nr:hypothetical protein BC936DRAFT_140111 [Jimgerdemannia flammicorona]
MMGGHLRRTRVEKSVDAAEGEGDEGADREVYGFCGKGDRKRCGVVEETGFRRTFGGRGCHLFFHDNGDEFRPFWSNCKQNLFINPHSQMATNLNGPATFADDGRSVIERPVQVHSGKRDNIHDIYEIDHTVQKILDGNYEKIALQFPDELLADSTAVASLLRDRTGKRVYILADTSYGSCCVDEVAAEHVSADLIIHYGRSCLSPTSRLPVLYAFGRQPVDIDYCIQEFNRLLHDDKSRPIIIMCDVAYAHVTDTLITRLRQTHNYTGLIPTEIQTESNLQRTLGTDAPAFSLSLPAQEPATGALSCACGTHEGGSCCRSRPALPPTSSSQPARGGRHYDLPEGVKVEDCSVFYVGGESLTLTNIVMTHSKCKVGVG